MPYGYEGFYARFESHDKKNIGILNSADTLVGDEYVFDIVEEGGTASARLKNRFGGEVGVFDSSTARKLQLAKARDLKIHVILSFLAITEGSDGSYYWGEMAVIYYEKPMVNEFEPFINNIRKKMNEGNRPRVDLTEIEVNKTVDERGWVPEGTVPYPKSAGTAIVKDKRSVTDNLVESGRAGNVGCYAISIIFLVFVVGFLVTSVQSCIG